MKSEFLHEFRKMFKEELERSGERYPVEIEEILECFETAGIRAVVELYQNGQRPTIPVPAAQIPMEQ